MHQGSSKSSINTSVSVNSNLVSASLSQEAESTDTANEPLYLREQHENSDEKVYQKKIQELQEIPQRSKKYIFRKRWKEANPIIMVTYESLSGIKLSNDAYEDENQIYTSNLDSLALEKCICQELNVANQWYKNNGMIVNEKKHQALILGKN